ncbi:MAG: formyltetrahydrofolate deformylase [Spirochaetaceae bacterium]|jgi:formyltetrahydrofolate deformylase|nr:formyltetrahydrofolate deformylase [Spirochaetaceae bacterium]
MKNTVSAILLISCQDQRGLVAEVSFFISTYNGNIISSDQHNDSSGAFFMRVEWDLEDFNIPREKIASAFDPLASKYNMDWSLKFSADKPKIAIMVSKYDHCLLEILHQKHSGELKGEIVLVIGNHEDTQPLAEYYGVDFKYLPITKASKKQVEEQQINLLKDLDIDLIILARYMQILSPEFVAQFPRKIINIHHSFLPAFIGAKPYHQAFERGVKIIGATSHYVTSNLDQGPIIHQDVIRVSHRDSVEDLAGKGRTLEKSVLQKAVKCHLDHRVLTFGNKTVVFD